MRCSNRTAADGCGKCAHLWIWLVGSVHAQNATRKTPRMFGKKSVVTSTGMVSMATSPLQSRKLRRHRSSGAMWCTRNGRRNLSPTRGQSSLPHVSADQCTTPETKSATGNAMATAHASRHPKRCIRATFTNNNTTADAIDTASIVRTRRDVSSSAEWSLSWFSRLMPRL